MRHLKKFLCYGFMVIMLPGCLATVNVIEKKTQVSANEIFQVTLPVGWVRDQIAWYYVKNKGRLMRLEVNRITATRDGDNLQLMQFSKYKPDQAFRHIEKPYKPSMLPAEAAELLIADLKKQGLDSLKVHSNKPARIDGHQGFRLHISYKNNQGLQFEHLIYAFGDKTGFYRLSYQAPSLHYFPKYSSAFGRAVKSFRRVSARTVTK